jgi:hypothetical protein
MRSLLEQIFLVSRRRGRFFINIDPSMLISMARHLVFGGQFRILPGKFPIFENTIQFFCLPLVCKVICKNFLILNFAYRN